MRTEEEGTEEEGTEAAGMAAAGMAAGAGVAGAGALIGRDITTPITADITTLITGITPVTGILTHIGTTTPIDGCCR
jgi:hypothetical protein